MNGASVLSVRRLGALCALLLAAASAGVFTRRSLAQDPSASPNSSRSRRADSIPQATPTPSKKEEEVTLASDDVVRVETNLTNLFFTAADKQKRVISSLKREDVRVLEDGIPQE